MQQDRITELCAKIAAEADSKKLTELILELTNVLNDEQKDIKERIRTTSNLGN